MNLLTNQSLDQKTRLLTALVWIAMLAATVFAYLPGLGGPFLLDDFGSIAPLGDLGGVRDWATFKAFVFGGHAGPTGRPLSLLSFLVDANNWPADSWAFKRTNLVIHLLNGVLLGLVVRSVLGVLQYDQGRARWIAAISAGIWLLHPFLVSTTLYAVQRMAQLSTLFIFAGLLGHLYGRSLLARNPRRSYLLMTLSMGVFTILATLSKENGILLPMLIGVMEMTLFASSRSAALNRGWLWFFVIAPTAIVFLYLARVALTQNFFEIHPPRDFSIYERLLTQPRILFDYLQHWFLPKLYTSGIFQDDIVKSTGLFAPVSTALSILLHGLILALCFWRRRQFPLLAFALLFFYASHLLESSVINLELYFEHRNYMPVAFLFMPLVVFAREHLKAPVFMTGAAIVLLCLTGFTRFSATVWSDYSSMVEMAAQKAPLSARAQGQYAVDLYNDRRYDEALGVLERAAELRPDSALLHLTKTSIYCGLGALDDSSMAAATEVIVQEPYDPRSIQLYTTLTTSVVNDACPRVSLDQLRALFIRMLDVPLNNDPKSLRYSQIQYFIGFTDAHRGEPALAVEAFEASLGARPGAGHAMMMAAVMAGQEYHDEALYLSDIALADLATAPSTGLDSKRVRESDILEFRATVEADRDAARAAAD